MPLRVWTDSSAAIGICSRQGLGKLRHLDTHTLWVQQAVRSRRFELKKVLGEENPADLFTKHSLSKERLEKLVELFDCQFREGRAASAPAMRTGASDKQTIADADRPGKARSKPLSGDSALSTVRAGQCGPWMPHNELDNKELDLAYPSLEAVEELKLDDLTRLEDDLLYGVGMKIVQAILDEMSVNGRTRRATPEEATTDSRASSRTLSRRSVRFHTASGDGAAIPE